MICERCGNEIGGGDVTGDGTLALPEATCETVTGTVHWDCATLAEQRAEDFQCERCGAQFHDDGRDSDAGWIVTFSPTHVLCPNCQTLAEDREHTVAFLDQVTLGQLNAELSGEHYPADLAALAEREAERLQRATEELP